MKAMTPCVRNISAWRHSIRHKDWRECYLHPGGMLASFYAPSRPSIPDKSRISDPGNALRKPNDDLENHPVSSNSDASHGHCQRKPFPTMLPHSSLLKPNASSCLADLVCTTQLCIFLIRFQLTQDSIANVRPILQIILDVNHNDPAALQYALRSG